MKDKMVYIIISALLALAVVITCLLLFRKPEEPAPQPAAEPTPTVTVTAKPTLSPTPTAEPEPTEQPPTITPPAAYSTSGSDIQLWPVLPASSSDVQPPPASNSDLNP